MPKQVSKKNMHNDGELHNNGGLISPKRNYYGSLADYKESMTESIDTDTTTNIPNNTTFQMGQEDSSYDRSGKPGGCRFVK